MKHRPLPAATLLLAFCSRVPALANPIYAIVGQSHLYRADLTTGTGVLLGVEPTYTAIQFMPGTADLFGIIPVDGAFQVAELFPLTGSFTAVGPTFTMGGQTPTEMTFGPDGSVYVSGPFGELLKVDIPGGTVTSVRANYCETGFDCASGLAWLDGSLIQAAFCKASAGLCETVHYYGVDPTTGATTLLSTGTIADGGAQFGNAVFWLDTLGTQLYLGTQTQQAGIIFWGVADPFAGTFSKLSDNHIFNAFSRGLALEQTTAPEPSTLVFGAIGITLIALGRRRNRFP